MELLAALAYRLVTEVLLILDPMIVMSFYHHLCQVTKPDLNLMRQSLWLAQSSSFTNAPY